MKNTAIFTWSALTAAILISNTYANESEINKDDNIDRINIYADKIFRDTTAISPSSLITGDELNAINLLTSEDAVAYEPSLVIRRRYVGDPNGTLGIRGSGMFQTARSLVFADGLPLHYLLQTRWSGSPRWSLVGPDEIETAEVIYGPYSAEYSGNAMGGVVNITTRTPEKQRFVAQGSLISQQYDVLGTDESFNGNRVFFSYEDQIGNLGVFASFNRLANTSQPMTNYSLSADDEAALIADGVSGYISGTDDEGKDVVYIGDSGGEKSLTELYKLKLVYDFDTAQLRSIVAYENRASDEDDKRNYLMDSQGETYWGAGNTNFEERSHKRNSLLLGLGLSGELAAEWHYDVYLTNFDLQKDEELRTGLNTSDPSFGSRNGRSTQYNNTGWQTFATKLGTESLFHRDDMRLSIGAASDRYTLAIEPFNTNGLTGEFISERTESAGETRTQSVFAQYGWAMNEQWDLALGLRWENWETRNGFYDDTRAPDRSESDSSPKLSVAYMPNDAWRIRYSLARALRFPIAEELYRNEDATTSIIVSDPTLQAEDGIFHNLSFERLYEDGAVRVNLFQDNVDDTIYYQSGTLNDNGTNVSVNTFLAIDEVSTRGVEFLWQQKNLAQRPLDVRFNISYTHARIETNMTNTSIEGNQMPRIPQWRANLIATYRVSQQLNLNVSARYASDSFGQLDNADTASQVYGAIDDYLFVNMRANWQLNKRVSVAVGIDNLFDELAYVAHPWPSRTFFLEGRYVFEGN